MRWKCMALLCLLLQGSLTAQFRLYLEHQWTAESREITSMAMSRDGRFLAVGEENGLLVLYDLDAGRPLHKLKAHHGDVTAISFDHQGKEMVSGGKDGKVSHWDLYSGRLVQTLKFGAEVTALSLAPDDRYLIAGGKKNVLYLWEFPSGSLKGQCKGHKKNVVAATFSQGGDQVLSVGQDRQMIVWDIHRLAPVRKTSIEARTMAGSGIDVESAMVSADGQLVAVGLEEHVLAKGGRSMIFKHNISFYNWTTGAEIVTLSGNKSDLNVLALTPDKQFAVTDHSTLQNPALAFWKLAGGSIQQTYPLEEKPSALALSEDGQWLAAAVKADGGSRAGLLVWKLSGVDGYERFDAGKTVSTSQGGFGPTIKLTSPEEPLINSPPRRRLAVMTLDSPGLEGDVGKTAAYLLESKLGNATLLELVERNQISQVLDELKLQQSGLTVADAAEVGAQLGAQSMLIGSLNKLGNLLIMTVKLVDVESGKIVGTREVQCSNATIETIADMVAVLAPTVAR